MGLKSIKGCHDNRDMAVPRLTLNVGHAELTRAQDSHVKHLCDRKHPAIIQATCTDGKQLPRKPIDCFDTPATALREFTPLKQRVSLNNLATGDSLESLELRSLLYESTSFSEKSRENTLHAESQKLLVYQKGETTDAEEKDRDETGVFAEDKNQLINKSNGLKENLMMKSSGMENKDRTGNQGRTKSKRKHGPKRGNPDKLKLFTENCLAAVYRAEKSGEDAMKQEKIVDKEGKDFQMENLKEMSYQYVDLPVKQAKENYFSKKCSDEKFDKKVQNDVSKDDVKESRKRATVNMDLEENEMPWNMKTGSVELTNTAADDDAETLNSSRLLMKSEVGKRRVAPMEKERERKDLALIHAALTKAKTGENKKKKNMFNIQLVSEPQTQLHSLEDNQLLEKSLQIQDSEQTSLKLCSDPLNQKKQSWSKYLHTDVLDQDGQPAGSKVFYRDKEVNDFPVQMSPIMGELESDEPLEPVENTCIFAPCTQYRSLHSFGRDVFMSCMDSVQGQGQKEGHTWEKANDDRERDSSLKKAVHHKIQDHMLRLGRCEDDENDNELKYSPEEKPVIEPEEKISTDFAVASDADDEVENITSFDTAVEDKEAEAIEHEDVSGFPEECDDETEMVNAEPNVFDNAEPVEETKVDIFDESEHLVEPEVEAVCVDEIVEDMEKNIDDLFIVTVGSTDIGRPDEDDVTDAEIESNKMEIIFEKDTSGPEKNLRRKLKKNIHKAKERRDKRGHDIPDKDKHADEEGADEDSGYGAYLTKDDVKLNTVKGKKKSKCFRKRDAKKLSEVRLKSRSTPVPSKDRKKGWNASRRQRLSMKSKPNEHGHDLLGVKISREDGPFDLSYSKRRNRSNPLDNLGRQSGGRRCSNHGSSGGNGMQGGSGSRSGGYEKPSDNSKDNNNGSNFPNRENKEDKDRGNNSSGQYPSWTPVAADVPEFDPKGPRKKHSDMSDLESSIFLGKLIAQTQEQEAPMFEIQIDRVHYCLLRCLYNPEFESADMLSCCFCNIVNSLLKHYADCQAVYNDCKMCVQIFSLICAHVNTCMKIEPCAGRLCTVIIQHLAGESIAAHIRTLWFRIRKKLARLIGGTDIVVEPLRDPTSRISTRSSRTHSIGLQPTLPSIPETGPASHTSSNSGSRVLMRKTSNLPDVSENTSNNAPESVDNSQIPLATTGESPSLMLIDMGPRHRYSTGIHSLPMGPPAWPEPSYPSFKEHPTGTKGIGEVVVSNKQQLKKVAQMWDTPKRRYLDEGRLAHHYSEEGIILMEYKDKLSVAGIRYGLDFQWVKVSHLGNGMSGKCSLAKDFTTEFLFCVKEIHISNYELQEIELWLDLDHPHIVKMYGAIRHAEKIYIFMEFVEGGCLTEVINQQKLLNQRLSQHTALLYFKQILEVLIYLKTKQILHEDIKADNLLLHKKNNSIAIKVTDFGLARRCQKLVPKNTKPIGTQTQWSPQKAQGVQYGFCAEVWAATCVFIHMLTGQPPWIKRYGQQANKTLIFVIVEKSPPIEDIPRNIDGAIKDLVELALARDRDQRPTAEQLLQHRAFSLLDEDPSTNKFSILESGVKMSTQLDSKDNSDLINIVKGLTNNSNSTHQSKIICPEDVDRTSNRLASQAAGQDHPAQMYGRDQRFPSDIIAYPMVPELNLDPTNHLFNFINDPGMQLGPVGMVRPNNLTLYEPERTGEISDVPREAENPSMEEILPRFELISTLSGGDRLEGIGYMSNDEEDEEKEDIFKEFVLDEAIEELKQSGRVVDEVTSMSSERTRNDAMPIVPSNIPNVLEMVLSRSTSFHQSDDVQLSNSGLENEHKASDTSLPANQVRESNLTSSSKQSRLFESVTDAENEDYLFISGPDESALVYHKSQQPHSSEVTAVDSTSTFSPAGPTSGWTLYTPPSDVPAILHNSGSNETSRMSHSQSSPSLFVTSPMPAFTSTGALVGQNQSPGSQQQFIGFQQQISASRHQFTSSQHQFPGSQHQSPGSQHGFLGSKDQSDQSLQYQPSQHIRRVLSSEPIVRSPYQNPAGKEAHSLSPYQQSASPASAPPKYFSPNQGVLPVSHTGPSTSRVASAEMTRSNIPARHIQKADINAKNESKRFEYMNVTNNPRPPQLGTIPTNSLHIDVTKAQCITSHTQQQVLQTAPILSPPKSVAFNRGTSLTTPNQRKSTSSQSSPPLSTGSASKSQFEAQEDALKLLGKTAEDALSEHSDHMMNFHQQFLDPEDETIRNEFDDFNIDNPAESLAHLLDNVEDEHINVVFLNKCDGRQFKMRFSTSYKEKTWCDILEQEDVIMTMIHDTFSVLRFHLQLEDGSDMDLDSKLGATSLTVHINDAPTSANWWVEKGVLMRA